MSKTNRNLSVLYPEEKEGRTKDANKKLRSQIRSLKKVIKQYESEVKTLKRALNKSCNYIQEKLNKSDLESVLENVDDFDYKENSKEKEVKEQEKCPNCGKNEKEGFAVLDFVDFKIKSCSFCKYKLKVNDEGNERS